MTELDLSAAVSASLTDSKICRTCETILQGVDDCTRSNSGTFPQEVIKKRHGSFCLKIVGRKAAACHLCSLVLSLFNNDEQKELEDEDLGLESQWSSGTLLALLVGTKSLNVEKISKGSIAFLSIFLED